MHIIEVFMIYIINHPLFGIYLYFQIGIICAVIYSIIAHVNHDIDSEDTFLGFIVSLILFWPFVLAFLAPICLVAFIAIIGETVADVIERNK